MLQPIYQPVQIIREGGKQSTETTYKNWDSIFNKKIDSVNAIVRETHKDKKTELLNVWQIVALCVGCSLGMLLVYVMVTKFKIVKRIV